MGDIERGGQLSFAGGQYGYELAKSLWFPYTSASAQPGRKVVREGPPSQLRSQESNQRKKGTFCSDRKRDYSDLG